MSGVAAAERVLRDAGEPLHYGTITARMLDRGLWSTTAARPDATVNGQIAASIRRHGAASPFVRISPGVYVVNDRVVPLPLTVTGEDSASATAYLDAAHSVLAKHSGRSPMHFVDVTSKALEVGLLESRGKPHDATLYARIVAEENRAESAGLQSRFTTLGNGLVGLTAWRRGSDGESGDADEISDTLRASLFDMEPAEFETVIGQVLARLGLDEIDVTAYHGAQGFDIRGTLNAAGAFPLRTVVQVKRWRRTVGVTEIQRVREAAAVDEHPMILTTSGFTKTAFADASTPGARPVGLIAGAKIVSLMMEHSIGVQRRRRDVFEPAPPTPQLTFTS